VPMMGVMMLGWRIGYYFMWINSNYLATKGITSLYLTIKLNMSHEQVLAAASHCVIRDVIPTG